MVLLSDLLLPHLPLVRLLLLLLLLLLSLLRALLSLLLGRLLLRSGRSRWASPATLLALRHPRPAHGPVSCRLLLPLRKLCVVVLRRVAVAVGVHDLASDDARPPLLAPRLRRLRLAGRLLAPPLDGRMGAGATKRPAEAARSAWRSQQPRGAAADELLRLDAARTGVSAGRNTADRPRDIPRRAVRVGSRLHLLLSPLRGRRWRQERHLAGLVLLLLLLLLLLLRLACTWAGVRGSSRAVGVPWVACARVNTRFMALAADAMA